MKNKKHEIDMCTGSIIGKMLLFAIPLMFSSILQLLFNAADIVVVGRFAGDDSLAAVGSTSSLINLLTNLFMGLSIGVNVLVARYYGLKDERQLSKTVHTAIRVSIISGIILTIVGLVGAGFLLKLMGTPGDVLRLATIYLRIYFVGMIPTMLYNFGSAILRAVGDTRRPLYYLLLAGVVNVILNLIFVIVFHMGVAGVALATVISQVISAFLVIRCLVMETGAIKLYLNKLEIDLDILKKIMAVGIPAGLQGTLFSFSNVIIQSSVNSFGEIVIAGSSAAANIEGFVYVAMNAFYQAAISFISQNMGAAKYDRINKIALRAQVCVIVTGLLLGNLVSHFSTSLLSLYTENPEAIKMGALRLSVIASSYALCGMMDVMVGIMRGLGSSVLPMIVSLIGACGFRILWIFTVFQVDKFHTFDMLCFSYPVSWTITFLAHLVCFLVVRKRVFKRVVR